MHVILYIDISISILIIENEREFISVFIFLYNGSIETTAILHFSSFSYE